MQLDNLDLRGIRRATNIAIDDIATHLNISESAYRNKEKGRNTLSLDEAGKLSALFGCSLVDLYNAALLTKKRHDVSLKSSD